MALKNGVTRAKGLKYSPTKWNNPSWTRYVISRRRWLCRYRVCTGFLHDNNWQSAQLLL